MKPNIRLEEEKNFKIERKVFDDKTFLAILKLMRLGYIESVESMIKEGKESVVLSAKGKDNNWLAIKIFRTAYSEFKNRWKYLVSDPRFSNIRKNRRVIAYAMVTKEYKNLKIASRNGVSCPEAVAFKENVLVTKFIGENGIPAPKLIDLILENPDEVYQLLMEQMEKLAKAGLVHTDLSPYNILLFDQLYILDFSQGVTSKHPLAKEFLEKDVKNINSYFKKQGAQIIEDEILIKKFSEMIKI